MTHRSSKKKDSGQVSVKSQLNATHLYCTQPKGSVSKFALEMGLLQTHNQAQVQVLIMENKTS